MLKNDGSSNMSLACCGRLAATAAHGSSIVYGLSPAFVLRTLRCWLGEAKLVENPEHGRTHSFRGGHTQDLINRKSPLYITLSAGGWKSAAFHEYLDKVKLEVDAVKESHALDSSDDEDEAMCDANVGLLPPACSEKDPTSVPSCQPSWAADLECILDDLEGPGPAPAGRVGCAPSTPGMTPIEPWHACYYSPTAPVRQVNDDDHT